MKTTSEKMYKENNRKFSDEKNREKTQERMLKKFSSEKGTR